MVRRVKIEGFKSLHSVEVEELPRLVVLFGPNAAGKSNFLDALLFLSQAATQRSLKEATEPPMRGYPSEAFTFPPGGLPELLRSPERALTIEVDAQLDEAVLRQTEAEVARAAGEAPGSTARPFRGSNLRYRLQVAITPKSGYLRVQEEYLSRLNAAGKPQGLPRIETINDKLEVRRRDGKHPRNEAIGLNHTILSTPLYAPQHPEIVTMRQEFEGWRFYYLEPRERMRRANPPGDVMDIGPMGEYLAPFLYRVKESHPKQFQSITRTLRAVIPSVERVDVSLNEQRGEVEVELVQEGIAYSTRVISEGTLRLLALLASMANPWKPAVIAFEEPENGIHPRRLRLVAELLANLAEGGQVQIIVNTHSALFCQHLLEIQRQRTLSGTHEPLVQLLACTRDEDGTHLTPYLLHRGPLFDQIDIDKSLSADEEPERIDQRILRGDFDA
jgi:predicted ATPase